MRVEKHVVCEHKLTIITLKMGAVMLVVEYFIIEYIIIEYFIIEYIIFIVRIPLEVLAFLLFTSMIV